MNEKTGALVSAIIATYQFVIDAMKILKKTKIDDP